MVWAVEVKGAGGCETGGNLLLSAVYMFSVVFDKSILECSSDGGFTSP